ncbi:MAG: 5-bromo-4-chloroindolyl phosphate hydrolysis family protein [Lachnospiraceae bacterium]|nr:5-bromo-4-chloroindolyl phosphate hydrolysis family protein [Lachnospiraceae bacterium]
MDFNFDDAVKAGGEILKDVESAVVSGDYSNLSSKVQGHVRSAADSISSEIKRTASDTARKYTGSWTHTGSGPRSSSERGSSLHPKRASEYGRDIRNRKDTDSDKAEMTPFLAGRKRADSSKLKRIAGIIGMVYGGLILLPNFIRMIVGIASGSGIFDSIISAGLGAVVLVLSILVFRKGMREQELSAAFSKYSKLIGDSEFFSVSDLAALTGSTAEEVEKTLSDMIESGYLPNAVFDRNRTTLLLTDTAIEQYRQAEKAYLDRIKNEQAQAAPADAKEDPESAAYSEEVRELLAEGQSYITHVRNVNDIIPDDQIMSDKLYRLENIMNRIFAQVRKDASSAKNLRRFMDYYLPTITKLLDAYVELDRQDLQSGNIAGPKREIEETMDTVNDAFEELLDSMFQNMAWDISSDISVMKTMMKQDGLTGEKVSSGKKEKVMVEAHGPETGGQL